MENKKRNNKAPVSRSPAMIGYALLLQMTWSDAIEFLAGLEQSNQLKSWVVKNCPQFIANDQTINSILLLKSLEA